MSFLSRWLHHDNIYRLHLVVYKAIGQWKMSSPSKWKQFVFSTYFYSMHMAFLMQVIFLVIDAYSVRKDIQKLSLNLCSTLIYGAMFLKVIVFDVKREKVLKILDQLENNLYEPDIGKSKADQEINEKYAKLIAEASKMLWLMGLPWCVFWCIFPVLDSGNEVRYPIPFPFQISESPIYELVYAFQVPVVISVSICALTYDMMFYGMIARVCVNYEIAAKNISEIKNLYSDAAEAEYSKDFAGCEEVDNEREKKVVRIIRANVNHHRAILRQITEINELFYIPLFIQFTFGGMIIAVVDYAIITETQTFSLEQIKRFINVGSLMLDIWLYCYFGSQLEAKSDLFKNALYDSPWYEMKTETVRLYIIILSNLQGKIRIKGGGIFPATLKTYKNMLKISYDVTAILRQTRKLKE